MLIDNKPSANIISNLEKNNGSSLLINYLISFLVGGTLVLFIFYAWILPYNKRVHDLTVDAINTAYDQEKSDYENHIRTLSQTEELLKLENGELNSLLDMLRSQVSLNDKMNNIDLAINKMDSREYDVAYYIINTIDADGLSDEYIQKYENLKTEAPAKAAGELYIAAMLDYDAKKYEEAIVRFEKARDIKEDADILYYLAMSESALGNQDRAAELFNIIIESYSTSLQFNNAQNRLNELTPPPSP
jgi:tetratricopeptide (TPR) repeat protein